MKKRGGKFLSYYRPYWALLCADLLCAMVMSGAALLLPICVRHITGVVLAGGSASPQRDLGVMGGVMLGLVGLHGLCNWFVDYQGHMMGAKMESDMRRELFAHYQRLSFSFYDGRQTGQLMSRIGHDLFALSELFHHGPEDIVIGLLKFCGVFIITVGINGELGLVLFLFLPVMLVFSYHFNRRMHAALLLSKQRIAEVNAQVEDTLAGIRVVQSFVNEGLEQEKFDAANGRFVESRRMEYRSEAAFFGGMGAFSQLMMAAVALAGAWHIMGGGLDISDLITFLLYVGILSEPIQRLVNFARWYQEGITGFHRFMDVLELRPGIADVEGARELGRVSGELELEDVSFRYRRDEAAVLKKLSLRLKAGEYMALVGVSGVGKSTLSMLIPRFYDVDGGRICLDGIDIREIGLSSLRRNIGVVQQDVYLFAATVLENIGYGRGDASREEIEEAAKKANAHGFIMGLPRGYETYVGQRGVRLSAGQRQRISIARVFLKDPPLLILDEATSALDYESERAVRESLERLMERRSVLVIAHRLSTVRNAERIAVMKDGGICEEGRHEELLARGGQYARLHEAQGG